MKGGSGKQVLSVLAPGPTGLTILRKALLGVAVLAFLLLWWSGWRWFPTVIWVVIPTLVVVLPGVRRLIDESWGLVVGLLVGALALTAYVPGELVAVAWGIAVAAVAGLMLVKGGFGWRKWVPIGALSVAGVLVVVGGIVWIIDAKDRAAEAQRQAQLAHEENVSKLLPTSPRSAVFGLVEGVAIPEKADRVCFTFSPVAAAQFAVAHQAADCLGALAKLRTEVRSFSDYVNQLSIPAQDEEKNPPPAGRPVHLDACHLEFTNFISGGDPEAGPQIGQLTFEQKYGNGFLITEYRPCL